MDEASDGEADLIREVAFRAGVLWRCPAPSPREEGECAWWNRGVEDVCGDCGRPREVDRTSAELAIAEWREAKAIEPGWERTDLSQDDATRSWVFSLVARESGQGFDEGDEIRGRVVGGVVVVNTLA